MSGPQNFRIALVSGALPHGGSSTFVLNLGGELIARGIPTLALSFDSENPYAADFERLRVPCALPNRSKTIFEDQMRQALGHLKKFAPNILVANISPLAFEVLRYAPPGVLRVGMVHADSDEVYEMIPHYVPHLDLLIAVSKHILEKLTRIPTLGGIKKQLLHLGVPMPQEGPRRTFSGPLRILYYGRLDQEQKRVHLFPEILKVLVAEKMAFQWTICGDGPSLESLRQSMRSPGDEQEVLFKPPQAYSEIPGLLEAHDVFILTSAYEGLPLSVVEAMARGVVPVVSDLPSGIRELIDERSGVLVDPSKTEKFAVALLKLDRDRKFLAGLSVEGSRKVRAHFSVEAMTDRFVEAFAAGHPGNGSWPEIANQKIYPPLPAAHSFRFSPLGTLFRRLRSKF